MVSRVSRVRGKVREPSRECLRTWYQPSGKQAGSAGVRKVSRGQQGQQGEQGEQGEQSEQLSAGI
jgi:hypothetical protein